MLDTNIASHIIRGDVPAVRERLVKVPITDLCVSVIKQAELLHGVAKRGRPPGLSVRVQEFLARVKTMAWTEDVANAYADLRTDCERAGTTLAPMDLMIAAHAMALGAVLVTNDQSFNQAPSGLTVQDWTRAGKTPRRR
jgi:tRNA(fMet)-specific endonuclease VapC